MATHSDLFVAINQIAAERNIEAEDVIEAIKYAIKTGFRKDYPEEQESLLEVEIQPGEAQPIRVFVNKKVVNKVETEATQIDLASAQKIEKKLQVGDHVLIDITPSGDFGRVAAQVAKQVILQKIRESEKETIMKEFVDRIGEIEYAVVQRLDMEDVIFEIRRAIAIMPKEDRIPYEFYKSGTRMKVLLKEIKLTPRGKQLIVSRSDPNFLIGLFKLEVPEIESGTVEIKSIAREAGSRSKIAVYSTTDGIDPIGACVGQKGVRIGAILNDLKFGNFEEKIDIILWNEDIVSFIANSLSPAVPNEIIVTNEEAKEVVAFINDEQLSLAIGKDGQNVRLAAKLTGWNIDILGESEKEAFKKELNKAKEKAEKKETKKEEKKEEKKEAKKESKKETKKTAKKTVKKEEKKTTTKKAASKKTAKKETKEKAVKKTVKKTATKKTVKKK